MSQAVVVAPMHGTSVNAIDKVLFRVFAFGKGFLNALHEIYLLAFPSGAAMLFFVDPAGCSAVMNNRLQAVLAITRNYVKRKLPTKLLILCKKSKCRPNLNLQRGHIFQVHFITNLVEILIHIFLTALQGLQIKMHLCNG